MNPRLSYLEAAVRGASPVRLVILLYGQAIEDLRRAAAEQARGDIESRTQSIHHALVVIAYLQATLDEEQGGSVAANLKRFYNQVRAGLVEAQCRKSTAALEQQIAHLMLLRDAWEQVDRSTTLPMTQGSGPELLTEASQATGNQPFEDRASGEWKA
jgi:flagellar secretion chaperone FliS